MRGGNLTQSQDFDSGRSGKGWKLTRLRTKTPARRTVVTVPVAKRRERVRCAATSLQKRKGEVFARCGQVFSNDKGVACGMFFS